MYDFVIIDLFNFFKFVFNLFKVYLFEGHKNIEYNILGKKRIT